MFNLTVDVEIVLQNAEERTELRKYAEYAMPPPKPTPNQNPETKEKKKNSYNAEDRRGFEALKELR